MVGRYCGLHGSFAHMPTVWHEGWRGSGWGGKGQGRAAGAVCGVSGRRPSQLLVAVLGGGLRLLLRLLPLLGRLPCLGPPL